MKLFIVLLRFSRNKSRASELLPEHNAWIARGFSDGVFRVVGTLQPAQGGVILAQGLQRAELEARLAEDPFVAQDVVTTEVLEVEPRRADARLGLLMGKEE